MHIHHIFSICSSVVTWYLGWYYNLIIEQWCTSVSVICWLAMLWINIQDWNSWVTWKIYFSVLRNFHIDKWLDWFTFLPAVCNDFLLSTSSPACTVVFLMTTMLTELRENLTVVLPWVLIVTDNKKMLNIHVYWLFLLYSLWTTHFISPLIGLIYFYYCP